MLGLAANKCQLIVSTQSSPLVDHLQLKDLIVVDRKDGETSLFPRPDPAALKRLVSRLLSWHSLG